MMNTRSINIEDNNSAVLFEQVFGQMIEQGIQTGMITKQQIVVLLEDMIQSVERGTLSSTLNSV
jgi:uncharacterized lipoprotein YajG